MILVCWHAITCMQQIVIEVCYAQLTSLYTNCHTILAIAVIWRSRSPINIFHWTPICPTSQPIIKSTLIHINKNDNPKYY